MSNSPSNGIETEGSKTFKSIHRILKILVGEGNVAEIRILGIEGNTSRNASGYYDDLEKAARDAEIYESDRNPNGIYYVLNPIDKAILARGVNRMRINGKPTTGDKDITSRRWFFVDFDSARPSGISATDAQVEEALSRAEKGKQFLIDRGFLEPILAASGNGAHLLFPIDLPNNQESTELIGGALKTLDAQFSDEKVTVDTAVSNAARICRAYGTTARKGDSTPERPHRTSKLIHVPAYIEEGSGETCSRQALELIASLAKTPELLGEGPTPGYEGLRLNVPEYLNDLDLAYEVKSGEYTKYIFDSCPLNADHGRDSMVFQLKNGAVGFHCFHNGCKGNKWAQFKKELGAPESRHYENGESAEDAFKGIAQDWQFKSAWEAIAHPQAMREVVIEGRLRRGEVMNIVASTKVGKSWLALHLLFCVALGVPWLGRKTTQGRVLLVDNELHDETIQNRLATVAESLQVSQINAAQFDYIDMRGSVADVAEIERQLSRFAPGELTLIVLDAKYRFFGMGQQENSNDDQTHFHNSIDRLARKQDCAIALVHHATKGNQSNKSVTDIGAGGGSQSRTVDCHMAIRPHKASDNHAVIDAAVRTFAPVKAQTIRWDFPLWSLDKDLKPVLKQEQTRMDSRQASKDQEALEHISNILRTAEGDHLSRYDIQTRFGAGKDRINRLLALGLRNNLFEHAGTRASRNNKPMDLFALCNPEQGSSQSHQEAI